VGGGKKVLFAACFAVGLLLVSFASWHIISVLQEEAAARGEYDELRDILRDQWDFAALLQRPSAPQDTSDSGDASTIPREPTGPIEPEPPQIDLSAFTAQNKDFVGWIMIHGTPINYPVVQGPDNDKYLHRTFNGHHNAAGSIFMDYRATRAFDTPIVFLYGHNMRDGSMFASLFRYLDNPEFMGLYPDIIVLTADGEVLTYYIFHVRTTHAFDEIYSLDFLNRAAAIEHFTNAPIGANRFLILSTCTEDTVTGRLLVYAALIEETPPQEGAFRL